MTISPDQARELLDGATPGPWMLNPYGNILQGDSMEGPVTAVIGLMYRNDPDDTASGELMAAAPELAQTIAGMRWEWRCEADFDGTWAGLTTWESSPDYARATMQRRHRYPVRLVRRLVGPVEVTE